MWFGVESRLVHTKDITDGGRVRLFVLVSFQSSRLPNLHTRQNRSKLRLRSLSSSSIDRSPVPTKTKMQALQKYICCLYSSLPDIATAASTPCAVCHRRLRKRPELATAETDATTGGSALNPHRIRSLPTRTRQRRTRNSRWEGALRSLITLIRF